MVKRIIVGISVILVVIFTVVVVAGGYKDENSGSGMYIYFTKEWTGSNGKGKVKLYNSAYAVKDNLKSILRPDKYGNLKYKVLDQKNDYMYVKIRSRDFGYGWVYTGKHGTGTTPGMFFRYIAPMGSKASRYEYIFGKGKMKYDSEAEAKKNMVVLEIKVWKANSSGQKYTSKVYLEVNKKLEGTVRTIFDEIYEDAEKFPIKTIGGWRWPSEYINHPSGTAIDINWEENYYKKGDTIIGKFWKPYENIYSMPPDGSVVKTFKKYKWDWGGDWTSLKDYMHFSYLGG